jgi:DNA-binding PadR family transcriptional regulator
MKFDASDEPPAHLADEAQPDPEPIRLTGTSYAVLSLLELAGSATPYELKRALEQSIENFWPVPHTTFYAEPARLARGGFLSVRQEQGGRRRKLYALTDSGRQTLHEWLGSPAAAPPQYRDEGILKIFAGADPLPVLRRRRDWHRAKLAELGGYLDAVEAGQGAPGVRVSLIVGTSYHRQLLEATERLLAEAEADAAQAATGSS